jgi:cellobiose phosphorylase
MYRLVTESLLGLNREGNRLRLQPCVPPEWKKFAIQYRYGETIYHIMVTQNSGRSQIAVDGNPLAGDFITLVDDCREHYVDLRLGKERRARMAVGRLAPVHSST